MNDGLMVGMVLGMVLLSAPPLLLAFGIGIYVLRRRRSEEGGDG